jgi:hypothetical protein
LLGKAITDATSSNIMPDSAQTWLDSRVESLTLHLLLSLKLDKFLQARVLLQGIYVLAYWGHPSDLLYSLI